MSRLRITEIFFSLQGESKTIGFPTVFIRLTGCPLRCQYCDTTYAFTGGQWISVDEILMQVAQYHTRYVTVTGGEPLAQKPCLELLTRLCDQSYEVSLETSGALDVSGVDSRVAKVLDLKTPGSKEVDRNLYQNIQYLSDRDQVKFVICDRNDYEWSKKKLEEFQLTKKCHVLFSPSYEQMTAKDLAEWVLEDRLPIQFQVQLHKILWGNEPGR